MERQVEFRNQLFSISEAAHHLRISRSFLYKLIAAGSIKPAKLGQRTLITGAELEAVTNVAQGVSP
jgi:excisionase family DNA binding protein